MLVGVGVCFSARTLAGVCKGTGSGSPTACDPALPEHRTSIRRQTSPAETKRNFSEIAPFTREISKNEEKKKGCYHC